jgi:ferric-dicitrate binding protein FerR (iron transport regulator)
MTLRLRTVYATIAALLATILLAGALPARAADRAVGRVVQQVGDVQVMRDAATTRPAAGAEIFRRDRILSGGDGRIKIEFADRSLIAIGTDSEVFIADYAVGGDGRRLSALLSLLSGIVRAVVAEPDGSFDITSRAAVASARSTEWLMEATGDGAAVFAAAGTVAVQSVGTNTVVQLTPGMGTDVPLGGAPTPPKLWGKARVDAFVARTRLTSE